MCTGVVCCAAVCSTGQCGIFLNLAVAVGVNTHPAPDVKRASVCHSDRPSLAGSGLLGSRSSPGQCVKHWGNIFCLPEQLLINCPFTRLKTPPPPPCCTLSQFLPGSLTLTPLPLPLNEPQGCQGRWKAGRGGVSGNEGRIYEERDRTRAGAVLLCTSLSSTRCHNTASAL